MNTTVQLNALSVGASPAQTSRPKSGGGAAPTRTARDPGATGLRPPSLSQTAAITESLVANGSSDAAATPRTLKPFGVTMLPSDPSPTPAETLAKLEEAATGREVLKEPASLPEPGHSMMDDVAWPQPLPPSVEETTTPKPLTVTPTIPDNTVMQVAADTVPEAAEATGTPVEA